MKWLKKSFIPHQGNDHRPHILRNSGAHTLILIIIFVEVAAFVIPSVANLNLSPGMAAVLPAILGELTNEQRQAENLPVLAVSPLLTKAAEMKAADMALKSYFAHTSPEGITPWYWIELAGYKYQYAGENLAVNFRDSKDVTVAWLKSPTHRANIVKGNYTEMGTGIARGKYKGKNTVFVAQVYANPLSVASSQIIGQVSRESSGSSNVLGAETEIVTREPTFWQKLLAAPRNTTNILMSIIFTIIAIALVLYIAIKMRGHERDLIGNGLAMLAIIGAIMVANYYASYRNMVVTQSFDYAFEDTI